MSLLHRPPKRAVDPSLQDYLDHFSERQADMRRYAEADLPALGSQTSCPKCGCEDLVVDWQGGRTPSPNYPGAHFETEHFDVTCKRCRYSWQEGVEPERRQLQPPAESTQS